MAKYIDAEAAQADGWRIQRFIITKESSVIETRDITSLPAADVVEVVRCGECKYGKRIRNDCILVSCEIGSLVQSEDFFCANGERKDEDGE